MSACTDHSQDTNAILLLKIWSKQDLYNYMLRMSRTTPLIRRRSNAVSMTVVSTSDSFLMRCVSHSSLARARPISSQQSMFPLCAFIRRHLQTSTKIASSSCQATHPEERSTHRYLLFLFRFTRTPSVSTNDVLYHSVSSTLIFSLSISKWSSSLMSTPSTLSFWVFSSIIMDDVGIVSFLNESLTIPFSTSQGSTLFSSKNPISCRRDDSTLRIVRESTRSPAVGTIRLSDVSLLATKMSSDGHPYVIAYFLAEHDVSTLESWRQLLLWKTFHHECSVRHTLPRKLSCHLPFSFIWWFANPHVYVNLFVCIKRFIILKSYLIVWHAQQYWIQNCGTNRDDSVIFFCCEISMQLVLKGWKLTFVRFDVSKVFRMMSVVSNVIEITCTRMLKNTESLPDSFFLEFFLITISVEKGRRWYIYIISTSLWLFDHSFFRRVLSLSKRRDYSPM